MPVRTVFMCADDEVPRALGVEQDYEQLRTAAQHRIAEKQEELQTVMLRKAAAEEVDLSALKSTGARWPVANPNRIFPCALACSYPTSASFWVQGLQCKQPRRKMRSGGRAAATSSLLPVQRRLSLMHRLSCHCGKARQLRSQSVCDGCLLRCASAAGT